MKKSTLFSSLIAGTLVLSGLPASVMADNWTANTPSEIAQLNKNGTYTVRQGDTIWAIGMHYNIKPQVIEQMNGINNPYALQIGTILNLHIYDHGKKADLTITNTNGVAVKRKLTNKDKLDKHKAFGQSIKTKDLTTKESKLKKHDLSTNKSQKQSEASSLLQSQNSSQQKTLTASASQQSNVTSSSSQQNVINTPEQAVQAAINKYGTNNGQWRWGYMGTGSYNNLQYRWNANGNVSNNDPNGFFIVRNYELNDPTSGDGGLINTYIVYPNGRIVLDNDGEW